MAKKRDIVITIGPDGNVQLTVEGVAGPDCMDFTKFLEDELGDVTERTHTSEYYCDTEETVETVGSTE
tara:strand:+ start:675 stop:878 length:204 start_codon:yes stop_codon:yes gene_type:complete